jgi:hypothetical protein
MAYNKCNESAINYDGLLTASLPIPPPPFSTPGLCPTTLAGPHPIPHSARPQSTQAAANAVPKAAGNDPAPGVHATDAAVPLGLCKNALGVTST